MNPRIIFDLSEVLIFGLFGVEKSLSAILPLPESELFKCFAGNLLEEFVGEKSLKKSIRDNFQREVEGTRPILPHLAQKHEVVLLSDHARE